MRINIGESFDSFRVLRESNAYYVDKTLMLKEYLEDSFKSSVLFARPRRFGKTLTMTMFRDFLDIRQNSKSIFDGLRIMEFPDFVDHYMNQYPVIFLSMKEVFGKDYAQVFSNFRLAVSTLCKSMKDLVSSNKINDSDKILFKEMELQEANEANTIAFLALLSRMLHDHYGKPVFIIIDEYDVPMAKALGTQCYEDVRDMIAHMLSYVCKTNDHVKAVMLSGCLYTIKNSTYTGVNNIIPYTILSPRYASSIGFTNDDVKSLLEDAGIPDQLETIAEWYDGYIFGREKMYCPWDVLQYVSSVLDGSYSEEMGPESYWLNTSETSLDVIHGFLGKTSNVDESFEQLLAGKSIMCTVNDHLPYHKIHESGDNLWSALLETGYLTKDVTERMPRMPLRIPNRSIKVVFQQEVWSFFKTRISNAFVTDLEHALWAGAIDHAESSLNQILEATLSFYHEYHEYSYHLILDGFFTGLGYRVLSEVESGYGRSDLIVLDPTAKRCLIMELKHVGKEDQLQSALDEAVCQIIKKKYESLLIYHDYTSRLQYGMAFYDKKVRIKRICDEKILDIPDFDEHT